LVVAIGDVCLVHLYGTVGRIGTDNGLDVALEGLAKLNSIVGNIQEGSEVIS
jgi:hypothetical protein